jgi:hypothetical protein
MRGRVMMVDISILHAIFCNLDSCNDCAVRVTWPPWDFFFSIGKFYYFWNIIWIFTEIFFLGNSQIMCAMVHGETLWWSWYPTARVRFFPSALRPPPSALRPPPSALRPPPSALRPPPPPSALRPPPSALRPPPALLPPPYLTALSSSLTSLASFPIAEVSTSLSTSTPPPLPVNPKKTFLW